LPLTQDLNYRSTCDINTSKQ